jgi:hypothetical protein
LRGFVAQDLERPGRRPRRDVLSEVALDRLYHRNVMGYLFLLGGKLLLVGNELFYAAPYKGEIDCHRFKPLPQFRRSVSRG